jgi:hypothetical protein
MWGEVGFESLCEFTTGKHDTSSTAPAFQPYICAQADNVPFIGAARMLFAKAQVIVQSKVGEHDEYR